MYNSLASLISINSQLSDLQTQATSGKKINSAADNAAIFLNAQTYSDRSTRINATNDRLTSALSTLNAGSTGLSQVKKLLQDTRATLKSASESQARQAASGIQKLQDTDPSNTQFTMQFGLQNGAAAAGNFNVTDVNTALAQNNGTLATDRYVTLGVGAAAQRLTAGTKLSFGAGGNNLNITIGATNADGTHVAPATADDATNITAYTIADLLSALQNKLNVSNTNSTVNTAANLSAINATFSYNGDSFAKDGYGNTDLTTPKGVTINKTTDGASYNAAAIAALNLTTAITSTRAANNNQVNYVEDKQLNTGTTGVQLYGVQHNYKAAVAARDADASRANAAKAYMKSFATLNQYVADSTVSGVNLLLNDSLKVNMNEKGNSETFQTGQIVSATGLGLADSSGNSVDVTVNNFATNYENGNNGVGLLNAIDKIDAALKVVDSVSSQIGFFTQTASDRKDFNTAMSKMLGQAANDLTAADMTEVSTKTAALQVQQSFAQTIMSNIKQSDQSLMQLLR